MNDCEFYKEYEPCGSMAAKKDLQLQILMEGCTEVAEILCKRFCCKGCDNAGRCPVRCGRC